MVQTSAFDRYPHTPERPTESRTLPVSRIGLAAGAIALTVVALVVHAGCVAGAGLSACVAGGATIYPPVDGGEFLLSEVMSLVLCLLGVTVALLTYIDGDRRLSRVAIVFSMLFLIAFVGENNAIRDDLRPQFLIILLVWLGIELLLRRAYAPIVLLLAGCFVAFIGSLGDHTTAIQFQNVFEQELDESVLAPVARVVGNAEEPLELLGWSLFVLAAISVCDVRRPAQRPTLSVVLALAAIVVLSVGATFLHLRDNELYEAERKFGLFCAAAGWGLAVAAAFLAYARRGATAYAYAGVFAVAVYWICVFTPAVYTHEHSKTISSWTWIFPLLSLHAFLLFRPREGAVRQRADAAAPVHSEPA